MSDLRLYDPFEQMQFTRTNCFLCGTVVSEMQHIPVFGSWLQQRYGLEEKELLLLDKSITTYSGLTMPCCDTCRTQHVEPLEQDAAQAAEQGLAGWQQLEPVRLYQWLAKMFYGILVTELITEQDPLIRPQYAVSENPKMLLKMQSFYQVLQSLRVPIVFDDFLPGSLFLVPVSPLEDDLPFEYQDDLTTMMFSIKLNDVALVACLLDNEIIKKAFRRIWADIEGKPLHPVQLAEFKARVFYAAYLLNVIPEYFARPVKPGDTYLVYDTLIDDVTNVIFNPFEVSAYAHMLEEMLKKWEIRSARILENPQQPLSFIYDGQNQFRPMERFEQ